MNAARNVSIVIVFVVLTTAAAFAQSISDTIRIDSVTVRASKAAWRENALVDSLTLLHYRSADLGELLLGFGGASVRRYGAGGAATVAPRGYSPQQVAVTWNGVNVTNPMLGQTDLSLLPVFFFDQAALRNEPNTLDGAPAGAVELTETMKANGVRVESWHSISSLYNVANALRVQTGNERWQTSLTAFDERNQNKFWYRNSTLFGNPVTGNAHAESNGNGASLGAKRVFGSNALRFGGFALQRDRNLPPTMLQLESNDEQNDRTAAGFIRFEHTGKTKVTTDVTTSLHAINFYEGATRTLYRSNSSVYTASITVLQRFKIIDASLRFQTVYADATVNPSVYNRAEWQHGLQVTLVRHIEAARLTVRAEGMQRLRENETLPFNYSLSLTETVSNAFTATLTHARLTRLPGLNDRYWQPGGNPDLEPELATRNNLKLSFQSRGAFALLASCDAYFDVVDNWIQWVPFGAVWSPHNVKTVKLYGVVPYLSLQRKFQNVQTVLTLRYNCNVAITSTSFAANDASVGKQLMYVPQQTFHTHAEVNGREWSAFASFNYVDARYTTTDHSDFLEAYHTLDLGLAYNVSVKRFGFTASAKIENATGTTYQSVVWQPMPQQVFSLTLNLYYHIPNS